MKYGLQAVWPKDEDLLNRNDSYEIIHSYFHPGLVPYEELSETEKDYDRRTAMETLKLIQKIGFGIKKVKN